ncbi:DgyrCDS11713 [Dimorphilus gyrociliatus]|uniref:Cilia- and flagella-associated protein 44 n=1 Tax=Dimorphilus gyrociliatus TaxID=2664684 RepID=A0A7I8W493_9ANNE|nr:DgyrCDS11713 [Dimorphilus gyrociliatus]
MDEEKEIIPQEEKDAPDDKEALSDESSTKSKPKYTFKKATAQLKAEAIRRYKLKHQISLDAHSQSFDQETLQSSDLTDSEGNLGRESVDSRDILDAGEKVRDEGNIPEVKAASESDELIKSKSSKNIKDKLSIPDEKKKIFDTDYSDIGKFYGAEENRENSPRLASPNEIPEKTNNETNLTKEDDIRPKSTSKKVEDNGGVTEHVENTIEREKTPVDDSIKDVPDPHEHSGRASEAPPAEQEQEKPQEDPKQEAQNTEETKEDGEVKPDVQAPAENEAENKDDSAETKADTDDADQTSAKNDENVKEPEEATNSGEAKTESDDKDKEEQAPAAESSDLKTDETKPEDAKEEVTEETKEEKSAEPQEPDEPKEEEEKVEEGKEPTAEEEKEEENTETKKEDEKEEEEKEPKQAVDTSEEDKKDDEKVSEETTEAAEKPIENTEDKPEEKTDIKENTEDTKEENVEDKKEELREQNEENTEVSQKQSEDQTKEERPVEKKMKQVRRKKVKEQPSTDEQTTGESEKVETKTIEDAEAEKPSEESLEKKDEAEDDEEWETVWVTDDEAEEDKEEKSGPVDGQDPNIRGDEYEIVSEASRPHSKGDDDEEAIPADFFYEADEYISSAKVTEGSGLPADMLKLYHSFGYDCHKRCNLNLLDDNHLIWVAGNLAQIIDINTKELQYIRSTSGGAIGHVAVHPQKTFIAVAEKGVGPRIIIYEWPSLKMKRILRGGTEQSYAYVEFNPDGKLLASVGGDPDYMLTLWDWKNERTVLRSKAFSQDVFRVSFNSELPGQLTSAGTGHVRFWRMAKTFTGLKLQGQLGKFGKTEISDVEGYVELPDGKVLSGCEWGNMLLWDGGLIKVEICRKNKKPCHVGPIQQIIMDEGELITVGLDGFIRVWNFETIDTADVSDEAAIFEMEPMNELRVGNHVHLRHLVKTVSEDDSVIWYAQDGNGGIWKLDLSFSFTSHAPEKIMSYHAGEILGVSASPVSHLVATTGADKTVRIIDYLSKQQICESAYSMSGHSILWMPKIVDPKGSTIAAGFADGVVRLFAFQQRESIDIHGRKQKDLNELALKQAFKPHTAAVNCMAVDSTGEVFATGSEDSTVFFMHIGNTFDAIGFIKTPSPVKYIEWSPGSFKKNTLLVCCLEGQVLEVACPEVGNYDTSKTFEISGLKVRTQEFKSVKSRLRHEEELERRRKEEEEARKKEEEERRIRIERGLEDPDQVDEEAEEEKRKAKEEEERKRREEEEAWEPYIPKEPSPILFGSYGKEEGEFWLSMGDFDAGYLYKYKFMEEDEKAKIDKDDLYKPIQSIPVKESDDIPLSSVKIGKTGQQIIIGMENGAVRIYTVKDANLADIDPFWQLSMHDNTYGQITYIDVSFDGSFLFTVGKDGNFFSYELMDDATVEKRVIENKAKIPSAKLSDDKKGTDIEDANAYSIEDAKQKAEYDKMMALAEQKKNSVRSIIDTLRDHFRGLIERNDQLPKHLQLDRTEFEMDPEIKKELHKQTEEKISMVHKEMAWEEEKQRIALEKLRKKFKDDVDCERIVVKSFNFSHQVATLRTAKLSETFHMVQAEVEKMRTTTTLKEELSKDPTETALLEEEEGKEQAKEEQEEDKKAHVTTLTGSVGERVLKQLARVDEKKKKRSERKLEWEELFKNKPSDDWEDPEDVAAIKYAKENMGDYKLKSSQSYIVPPHLRMTALKAKGRLLVLKQLMYDLKKKFNDKVLQLRQSKIETIQRIEYLVQQLENVQQHLKVDEIKDIPPIPTMDDEEIPEKKYEYNEETLLSFKEEMAEKRKRAGLPVGTGMAAAGFVQPPSKPVRLPTPQMTPRREMTRTETVTPSEFFYDIQATDESQLTDLERELLEMKNIRLKYEQDKILKDIGYLIRNFDAKLRTIRHEKFELDVTLKNADLRLLTLFEELQLLKEFEKQENILADKVEMKNTEKIDMQTKISDCQTRLTKKKKDLENLSEKEKQLYATFLQSLGENNRFADYLTKVFKKRIKRKKAKASDGDGDSDEDSESDSDDSDFEESDEDDESEGGGYDLDVCPPQCDQTLYDNTCSLREKRLDLEEEVAEEKKNMDSYKKELDTLQKKAKVIEQGLKNAENELEAFQQEKQRKINEFDVVVSLKLHQVQHHMNSTIPAG